MIYEQFKSEDAHILIWEITETVEELSSMLSNFEDYVVEFEKMGATKRKLEFLTVRIAFNLLLKRDVIVVYDKEGKPFLEDNSFNISISHTKNWVAVMTHPSKKVGIDIEGISDRVLKVYKKFLSDNEQKHLFTNDNNTEKLQLGWSAKEAIFKIIGLEAVDFKTQLMIYPFDYYDEGTLTVEHLPTKNVFQLNYKITEYFNLAYCAV